MEIIKTKKVDIRVRYDIETKKTEGDVYSKVEGKDEVLVGHVVEEPKGTCRLELLRGYENREYIKKEVEKLKPEFANYANMWTARESRGVC